MSESQIFVGLGLILALAAVCQVAAARLKLPAIVLLLPVGFIAGALTDTVNPNKLLGSTFPPMVDLAVAIVLFDGGLELVFRDLEGHSQRVVRRLITLGVPITWGSAAAFAALFLGLPRDTALMLGAILIVSGPTVVAPLLTLARPGKRLTTILGWESTTIDPIGAIIGALMFQFILSGASAHPPHGFLVFLANVAIGFVGAAVGLLVLWFVTKRIRISAALTTQVLIATVVAVAAGCDAVRSSTGLIAAIVMGVVLANKPGWLELGEHRPFFQTIVQLLIGLLFISIAATVTPASVAAVIWPTLALVICLVLIVRPIVAALATLRTDLSRRERAFIGWMDPRGIVAAATAASFGASLAAARIGHASDLLPATFVVIAGTVTIYGLTAAPLARLLGLTRSSGTDARAADAGAIEEGPAPPR
jgi:NhaP-type Na+/H+ or K+/H+ antiporter